MKEEILDRMPKWVKLLREWYLEEENKCGQNEDRIKS
jgi:hypothetical protein